MKDVRVQHLCDSVLPFLMQIQIQEAKGGFTLVATDQLINEIHRGQACNSKKSPRHALKRRAAFMSHHTASASSGWTCF